MALMVHCLFFLRSFYVCCLSQNCSLVLMKPLFSVKTYGDGSNVVIAGQTKSKSIWQAKPLKSIKVNPVFICGFDPLWVRKVDEDEAFPVDQDQGRALNVEGAWKWITVRNQTQSHSHMCRFSDS